MSGKCARVLAGGLIATFLAGGHGLAQVVTAPPPPPPPPPPPATIPHYTGVAVQVSIRSDLTPQVVLARPGDTIIWRNDSASTAVVSFASLAFDDRPSIVLDPGESFSLWFATPGTYPYSVSQPHAIGGIAPSPLRGAVEVVG